MFSKQAYVLGAVVVMSGTVYATNFKLSGSSVRSSHEVGKVKLVHSDKKGFTLFAQGKKYSIPNSNIDPDLRNVNNNQLKGFQKAGYLSVPLGKLYAAKAADGSLELLRTCLLKLPDMRWLTLSPLLLLAFRPGKLTSIDLFGNLKI